ncbi:hypothetical protein ACT17_34275 [Mycolicibacterium conceptionense]|uniref:Uncharacterized protein n=2 Tax=Mycolicibacterium conceptionense TaxID=451644 RepID=A0A0J8TVY5_9MYCO|nr:hypothetical protein ACT17_34275 [Mycolicibacterium conceptionense]
MRLCARSAWAASGTALIAVLIAIAAGGLTFALAAPESPPAAKPADTTEDNVRVALKAADDSRTMFALLSDALTSTSAGLTTAMDSVPQIFDSVDSAKVGAEQLAAGLDGSTTALHALGEVSRSAGAWANTLDQVQGISGLSTAVRTSAQHLRQHLIAHPAPGSAEVLAQLDQVLAATDGFTALESVGQLRSSLTTLTTLSTQSSTALDQARTAARQLRDGLTTLAGARQNAQAAATNLKTGAQQLSVALKSIDEQLVLIQTRLRSETVAEDHAALPIDSGTRLAWALFAAGAAGTVAYLLALLGGHEARRAVTLASAPAAAGHEPPAWAGLRVEDTAPQPSFWTGGVEDTNPGFPVRNARATAGTTCEIPL